MHLPGLRGQQSPTVLFDYSGSVATGGTAQLVAPNQPTRAYLHIENTSTASLAFGFGGAKATATIAGGVVTGITVTNAGFNYTTTPQVLLLGGGKEQTYPDGFAAPVSIPDLISNVPANPATAAAVMTSAAPLTGNKVSSITVLNPGSGYLSPPYVLILNDPRDPWGCILPTATTGIVLAAGGSFAMEASFCTSDAIAVLGGTLGQTFSCHMLVN